jgi:hypothetical protein
MIQTYCGQKRQKITLKLDGSTLQSKTTEYSLGKIQNVLTCGTFLFFHLDSWIFFQIALAK